MVDGRSVQSARSIAFRIIVLRFAFLGGVLAQERIRVDPETGHFLDKDGRTVLFHGVNVVQKYFPWHPSLGSFDARSSLNAEDMANLHKWGFNAVRLGVMWPGVEPAMGQYNETYLGVMRKLVDDLYSHGIYTIVDMHQDSMSEQWCGEGVPAWLLPMLGPLMNSCDGIGGKIGKLVGQCKPFSEFNISVDPSTGFPSSSGCLKNTFDQYSRTPELVSAWGNFYAYENVQQKFQAFWKRVAREFASSPGVLGYDLLNEPLNGNFFEDPGRIEPGYVDRVVLQPLYKKLHDIIRAEDPKAIVMYEPPPFPDTFPANIPALAGVHSMGSTSGPAGQDVAHQALSYHIYSCGFAVSNCDRKGDIPISPCPTCDRYASDAVSTRGADASRLGGGAFLTEFGACSGSESCLEEIRRVLGQADAALHSWAYWQFKYNHDITTVSGPIEGFYQDDGSLQTAKVTALSRTYAPTVAGRPLQMAYEPLTGAFRLRYNAETDVAHLPTEVFINEEMNYRDGYEVSALNATFKKGGQNRLEVAAAAANHNVDLAIARPYSGKRSGQFQSKDGDLIAWDLNDDKSSGFLFSSDLPWWKSLVVYTDSGDLLCQLSTQDDNHGPVACDLSGRHRHEFLFGYRIEIWKAKTFGVHTHVDTIDASMFGPLLNKRIQFRWLSDQKAQEQVVV